MGAYVAVNCKNLLVEFSRYSNMIIPVTLVLMLLMIWFKSNLTPIGNAIYPVFVFFGVLSTFIIAGNIVQAGGRLSRMPRILSEASFFVYAIHTVLILSYSTKVMHKILPGSNPIVMTASYLLPPLLCAAVCLAIYSLMSRFSPQLLGVLTGNRSRMSGDRSVTSG